MSVQRSGRASRSSAATRAARPPGGGRIMIQTPRSDVYVALLGVSLAAILIGSLLLVGVWGRYGYSTKAASLPHSATTLVA